MQEFQGGVEGGVAGRDIVNKAPAFLIGGNVGTALNVKEAGAVHIHVGAVPSTSPASEQDINRVVSTLLRTCDEAGCKQAVQRISLALFNNSMFKSLSIEQLLKLQRIADELATQSHEAMSKLDAVESTLLQTTQAKEFLQKKLDQQIAAAEQQALNAQRQIDTLRLTKPARPLCQTCSSATANLAKARRGLITIGGLAMAGLAAASYFSFATFQANQALKAAEARLTVCEFQGRTYSLGTVLVREDAPDWRCTGNNGLIAWEEMKPKRKK